MGGEAFTSSVRLICDLAERTMITDENEGNSLTSSAAPA